NWQVCHRASGEGIAGMVAPMSLVDYREVRPWAKAVAKAVSSKKMPPWSATTETLGQFSNERYMSDADRDIIVRWVETGAARGKAADAPEPKEFEDKQGWGIGIPDLIVRIPEPYWVADDVQDIQPRFSFAITEEHMSEPRWIQAIEIMPGSEGVHHAVASARAPEFGEHPAERFSAGSIAAGEDPIVYPEGFGNLLRPGTQISISMHYFKEVGPGTGFWDQTSIGFKFHEKGADVKYKVTRGGISARGWEIPPRQGDWLVGSSRTYNSDTVLISLHPHMHFRGKSMKYTAYYPDGTTETLLDVPDYNYAWQTQYHYKYPKFIPKGTRIDVMATYDNSETKKAEYPVIDIDRAIDFGGASTDEMMIPFIEWAEIDEADSQAFRAASPATPGTG
ncbi:MAG: hypothetical protein IID54_03300, partial [Proteobacteria bacterium]|nr:hypothetical protein [Pseudomonadota bacterium]